MSKETFQKQLTQLINSHCLENESNSPDFILAEYIMGCLDSYTNAAKKRDEWHGINPTPCKFGIIPVIE